MSRSTVVYDHIRAKSIQVHDIGDGIVITDDCILQSMHIPTDSIPVGAPGNKINYVTPKGTESIAVDIDRDKRELTFSLNPVRKEYLSYVSDPVSDTVHPYSLFVVEGMGDAIATLHLTPWTSYCVVAESISDVEGTFTRINNEWLIRYTDVVEIKQVNGHTHTLGNDIKPIISLTSQEHLLLLKSTINTMWTCKLSILRTRILNTM